MVTIASILIAMNLSAPVAEFFRDSVVYEQLTDNLHGKIEEYISDAMDEQKLVGASPPIFRKAFRCFLPVLEPMLTL